uniref:GB1/RHD3-type G domain-containing protein n=1 Tax=Calidris pygmaea TaxID=425635 RepID=A0A8C3K404_9CHAR
MASGILMPQPLCLVENHPRKGLVVQQEALKVLSEVTQPVVVVAITGLYRTGKEVPARFSLGSSVQSHTKGVWMWCFPHPRKPGHVLVLLDTEGLGDVEKGDTENDTWIFVLTLLLSSTLIYNSKGTIDQQAMEQLQYPWWDSRNQGWAPLPVGWARGCQSLVPQRAFWWCPWRCLVSLAVPRRGPLG